MKELEFKEVSLPFPIEEKLKSIPKELLDLPFEEIEKKCGHNIDLRRMRVSFWIEYDRAYRTQTAFSLANVFKGIMTGQGFQKHIISNTYKIIYLTTPPPSYQVIMEELLHFSLMLDREILALPHIDDEGKVDTKLLTIKHRVAQAVHNRVKGLPVNRSLMFTKDVGEDEPKQSQSLKDINQEIESIKKELTEGES